MDKLLTSYGQLPDSLQEDSSFTYGITPRATCPDCGSTDTCKLDSSGCGSEDCPDNSCFGDSGYQPPCSDCSDCSDCDDCNDIPVDLWSWSSSNGSASSSQTRAAYNVLMGNSTTDNFSYKVWNDFVDKVSETRLAVLGKDWSVAGNSYLSKSRCYVYQGDTLSADIYNSVKYNIGSLRSTGIQDVSRGDKLTGYHIIHIADVLNDLISDP